jgi:hypothetical protein
LKEQLLESKNSAESRDAEEKVVLDLLAEHGVHLSKLDCVMNESERVWLCPGNLFSSRLHNSN